MCSTLNILYKGNAIDKIPQENRKSRFQILPFKFQIYSLLFIIIQQTQSILNAIHHTTKSKIATYYLDRKKSI